ncbi:protein mahjong isoform X2 [Teleopsis dalmanni]|uniref:protein mahjong isoform X2 n=1 Tax=Teleopsis dalmanni TaxID=139649 RepID=UPI0018CDBD71|nr:protein mahjong isoform X2 [Teleopsis dalmanni]
MPPSDEDRLPNNERNRTNNDEQQQNLQNAEMNAYDEFLAEIAARPILMQDASTSTNNEGNNAQSGIAELNDMPAVLQLWESKHTQPNFDPVPLLIKLAEIFEKEFDVYMRKDPDPFDERHPYRTDPSCQYGLLLKQLFRKETFMNKLLNDYLRDNYFSRHNVNKSSLELNIIACRIILTIMPGMETSAVWQDEVDTLITRLYSWAEDSIEPLQSYATGLLASAMEVQEVVMSFREYNVRLVPKLLRRLHMLQAFYKPSNDFQSQITPNTSEQNSANISVEAEATSVVQRNLPNWMVDSAPQSPQRVEECPIQNATTLTQDSVANNSNLSLLLENSRDALINGNNARKLYIPIHPPTSETSQMLILRFLTAMGEYQDLLGLVFENNTLQLINGFITNIDRGDTRLAFEALKYLASLLVHKKFALLFIHWGGLEHLLKVPHSSLASTGVAICLYYLAYSEDAMERICTMPKSLIKELVSYGLWLLVRSYDSGKCHATMFFGLSFQFKVILDEFDNQDGLRKLYNVTAIMKILNPTSSEDNTETNEDVECASRQLVRHVCVALKRYMESHLFYKFNDYMRSQCPTSTNFSKIITKATKANLEQINEQVRILQEQITLRMFWKPVDQLLRLGGVKLLLNIIALSYDWTNSGKAETMRSALDVLSICCVMPQVYQALCNRLEIPDNTISSGMSAILGCAAGEIADGEVQKSALAVVCNCVCSPLMKKELNTNRCLKEPSTTKAWNATRRMRNTKYIEDLVQKAWESVCCNSGIIVLLMLVQVKAPITDADCIRGMACRALAGLARSERVRQIIGKLPLFASGQIQTLMRDPILQEKRAEHVIFQKYALELLERVSGKAKPTNNQLDPSLANIHKANVIAQTKIQYNEQQLLQLICEHLDSKGLTQSAQALQREAGLPSPIVTTKFFHQSPFDYKAMSSSSMGRIRLRNRMQDVQAAILYCSNDQINEEPSANNSLTATPIKLVKKGEKAHNTSITNLNTSNVSSQRSLQKQITSYYHDNTLQDTDGIPKINSISLNTIVTEYLTNQHALCNNPMTTCPQFDLFTPHKCPDPKPSRVLNSLHNLTARVFRAQSGYNTATLDRRYVHTNIAPWHSIRSNDYNETQFSCCSFLPNSNLILCGTQQGDIKAYNVNDCTEVFTFDCCSDCIDVINANRRGNLILTSCSWRTSMSILWSLKNNEVMHELDFPEDTYCEFSSLAQDKVLGTMAEIAHLYDLPTGKIISTFKPSISNQYSKNRATFHPTEEIVLSDGVLWDIRVHKEIHKFDKLNQTLSGVFHPNGLEIISNTEIWDMRSYHLLQTVPVLNQCFVKFSPMNVLYGYSFDNETRHDFDENNTYDTSFKVLDLYDYTSITTIDVKRYIQDMSIHHNGCTLGTVEHHMGYDSKQETYVKMYSVGMKRFDHEDEEDEEDQDSDEDASETDSNDPIVEVRPDGVYFRRRTRRRNRRNINFHNVVPDGEAQEDDDDDDDDDDEDDDIDDEDVINLFENMETDSDNNEDGEQEEGGSDEVELNSDPDSTSSENEFDESRFRLA